MIHRIIYFIYLSVSILGLLSGCAYRTTNDVMNSWKGAHISSVIQNWGPPTQTTFDGAGGYIYIWSKQGINHPDMLGTLYGIERKHPSPIIVSMFYVRSNGIIYHWLVK